MTEFVIVAVTPVTAVMTEKLKFRVQLLKVIVKKPRGSSAGAEALIRTVGREGLLWVDDEAVGTEVPGKCHDQLEFFLDKNDSQKAIYE
jgi:hypothetical protein